jgi:hypothetical protein
MPPSITGAEHAVLTHKTLKILPRNPRPLDDEPAFERLKSTSTTVVLTTLSAPQLGGKKEELCKKPGRCPNYRGRLIVTLIIVINGGMLVILHVLAKLIIKQGSSYWLLLKLVSWCARADGFASSHAQLQWCNVHNVNNGMLYVHVRHARDWALPHTWCAMPR